MINEDKNKFVHWNHFLALEKDLETISRFVELTNENNSTFSIELAKLLFSAASEFEVVSKSICKLLTQSQNPSTMDVIRENIKIQLPEISKERVYIPRYGLDFKPLLNWENYFYNKAEAQNPFWWKAYNKVKHHRIEYYNEANLQNTLNALGALLIAVTYYYKVHFENREGSSLHFATVNDRLGTATSLLRLDKNYYPVDMIIP